MNLEQDIEVAFFSNGVDPVEDQFIELNEDVTWKIGQKDLLRLVPSYMLWCVRNRDVNGNLVLDYTANALAEYGRSKNPDLEHLNFKFLCNAAQKEVVHKFLQWCIAEELVIDEEQVTRAYKNWG